MIASTAPAAPFRKPSRIIGSAPALVALLLSTATPASALLYLVTSAADPGNGVCDATCTLREAINASNGDAELSNSISFNIAGAGPHTITLASALPQITKLTGITGFIEQLAVGVPGIVLDGVNLGSGADGLSFSATADGSSVQYLAIVRFPGNGIEIASDSTSVSNCYVGVGTDGATDLGNNSAGIRVTGASATIGADSTTRNVISGNFGAGIEFAATSSSSSAAANYIGTNATGSAAIANILGVDLDGNGHTIGGPNANSRNFISGNTFGGIQVNGSDHFVRANFIGTDFDGTVAIPNGAYGVRFVNAVDCTVGGIGIGVGNVISGNAGDGLRIDPPSSNILIQGNLIGTDAAGSAPLGNADDGIQLGGSTHTVGGNSAGPRNVISANETGIRASGTDHIIQGNYIGTRSNGTQALGNATYGIVGEALVGAVIGGATVGHGNVIAGNQAGIRLGALSHDVRILNNVIGLDSTLSTDLADAGSGIEIVDSFDNDIGLPFQGNVVAGMNNHGVLISGAASTGNRIRSNRIGTNKVNSTTLGNLHNGVFIDGAWETTIGGAIDGDSNVIVHHQWAGVRVERGEGNEIGANSIHSNGVAIDIDAPGLHANDGGDGDDGGNRAQNYPLLSSALVNGGVTEVEGLLINEPNTTYRIDFYSGPSCELDGFGHAQTYRGSHEVTTGGGGQVHFAHSIPLAIADDYLSATVTDPLGNTSEVSPCASIGFGEFAGLLQFDESESYGYEAILPTAPVVVTRAVGVTGAVTVAFTTANASATAGSDYVDSDQTLSFAPWEVVREVDVPLLYDPAAEAGLEDVALALATPTGGASLGSPAGASLRILDYDDASPSVIVSDAHVVEGDGDEIFLYFDVTLSPTDHQVKVGYRAEPGSATGGEDYEPVVGELTFPPSSSPQTLQPDVSILGDLLSEGTEVVWLRVFPVVAGGTWVAFDGFGRGEIRDDDFPLPAPGDVLFADGLETGATSLWSATTP